MHKNRSKVKENCAEGTGRVNVQNRKPAANLCKLLVGFIFWPDADA